MLRSLMLMLVLICFIFNFLYHGCSRIFVRPSFHQDVWMNLQPTTTPLKLKNFALIRHALVCWNSMSIANNDLIKPFINIVLTFMLNT